MLCGQSATAHSDPLKSSDKTPDNAQIDVPTLSAPANSDLASFIFTIPPEKRITDYYELLDVLGHGSFGAVYACRPRISSSSGRLSWWERVKARFRGSSVRLSSAVATPSPSLPAAACSHRSMSTTALACKVLNKRDTQVIATEGGGVWLSRFGCSGLRRALTVDHPHVVKYFQFLQDSERCYIIMERMTGCDLFEWVLDVGPFSEREAAELFRQVLLAVAFVHENRACHCDIKPENFMFERPPHSRHPSASHLPPPNLKLVDFGSAIFEDLLSDDPADPPEPVDSATEPSILTLKSRPVQGTTGYCAPEVYGGVYNERADMFSAGVVLFVLLTCEMPFDCGSAERYRDAVRSLEKEGLWRVVNRRSDRLRGVSQEARDLVGQLLEPDPRKRISANHALQHPWLNKIDDDAHCQDEDTQLKRCNKKDVTE